MRISDWSSDVCSSDLPFTSFSDRAFQSLIVGLSVIIQPRDWQRTKQASQCGALPFRCKNSSMRALFRRFHQLNEYAAHILGVDKNNRRPVRPEDRKSTRLTSSH